MTEHEPTIAYCHSCGGPMDVTLLAPFTNVECPVCAKHTRVKREFGPYTLQRRLAIGGMSVVFTAQDNTLDREVAVKILNEDYSADERRISAFEQEARLTASLSHPHVVRVLTTGRAFGRFYIAMEMVAGGHFEHHIRERGRIPEAEMLPLAIQIAQGLKAAHAAGLIHRDVKPGNILLDADGNVKIVDFGLALVMHGGKAKAAELWATPYYVPPETIEGHPEDFRSDIYAFGATLYHALAGKPSCGEETMATDVLREAKKKVVPLHQAAPMLSAEVCRIVDKAMAYDPKDRFGSYEELIARLEAANKRSKLHGGRIETAGSATRRGARRKHLQRMAAVAGGMAAVLVLAAGVLRLSRSEKAAPPPPVVVVTDGNDTPKDAAAPVSNVANLYAEARAAVAAGDFEKAARVFAGLLENTDVQEPSRTWAGVEAVLASYLNGDPAGARRLAERVCGHATAADIGEEKIKASLVPLLEQLTGLPAIPPTGLDGTPALDAVTAVGWMLCGLKNWEQGKLDEAAAFFTALCGEPLSADAQWVSIYQEYARNYLADHELLTSPVFSGYPADKEGCERAVAELAEMQVRLKTRGRAKFNIRAWSLDLARHSGLLQRNPGASSPGKVDEAVVMAELAEKSAAYRFVEAADYLRKLPSGPSDDFRHALLSLAESSADFLSDLENDLRVREAPEPVDLKSGGSIVGLKVDETGNLRDAGGRQVEWEELSADSLINLHRHFVRDPENEAERLRRHACAISFDWLAGDRERATAAAARLATESPDFKNRWDKLTAGLPE